MAGAKQQYEFELTPAQYEYLTRMTSTHELPDVSKTLRCLVNYALSEPDRENAIFDEIRCPEC